MAYSKKKDISTFLFIIVAVIAIGFLTNKLYLRLDLTSDKRYTLSKTAKNIMRNLDETVYIRIYLDGEMPVQMKKFQQSIKDMLDEFKRFSRGNLLYEFKNPAEGNDKQRIAMQEELSRKGLTSLTVRENDSEGGARQKIIFPGALINYKGREQSVNFIHNNISLSSEENMNLAQQNLEYELVNVINQISVENKSKIAFIHGHGELNEAQVGDISTELRTHYDVEHIEINGDINLLKDYKVVIVAKPMEAWPEEDKFCVDQYIMNGGRVAWFIDAVNVHADSLASGEMTFGMVNEINLNDQLFNYGIRVNPTVVQDLQCAQIRVNVAPMGMPSDFRLAPWTYFPLLIPPLDNGITKGLNLIRSEYPGTIDTVGSSADVKKSIILRTSGKAMEGQAPIMLSLTQIDDRITERNFNKAYLPVAAVLEGSFTSPFRNRSVRMYSKTDFKEKSVPTKMIVVSDGDIIRNEVSRQGTRISVYPLGYDRHTNITYGNKDFIKNIVNYLSDDEGLMEIRNRSFSMRLLDKYKIAQNRTAIILVNTILPLIIVVLGGLIFLFIRKRKYAK